MVAFTDGVIRKRRVRDKWRWQGLVYRIEEDGSRKPVTKVFDVECSPITKDEKRRGKHREPRGKGAGAAKALLREWRESLVQAQRDLEAEEERRATRRGSKMMVPEYVELYWDSRPRKLEPETRRHYGYLLRHINRPPLNIPISELTPAIVREWCKLLSDEGLGASVRNKTFNQLKYACAWAVEGGDIEKNPCLRRDTPARGVYELNPLDTDGVSRLNELLENLQETKPELADLSEFALNTGMRIGECCGLGWDDVDGEMIHVRNTAVKSEGGCRLKPYPKNRHARDIPINDAVRRILKRRREAMVRHVGEDLSGCFVFARLESPSKHPSPEYWGKQWSMFASLTGLKGVAGKKPTFHDLRHTFATQAILHGVDIVTVASILGHRETSTTLRHYARWMPNTNASAMSRMSDVLSGKTQ